MTDDKKILSTFTNAVHYIGMPAAGAVATTLVAWEREIPNLLTDVFSRGRILRTGFSHTARSPSFLIDDDNRCRYQYDSSGGEITNQK